jgi:hypothetical protein
VLGGGGGVPPVSALAGNRAGCIGGGGLLGFLAESDFCTVYTLRQDILLYLWCVLNLPVT